MIDKPKVYWASPVEVPALPNTIENMVTNNLVKTRFILDKILNIINPSDKVAIKVHVGEAHNTHYLRPDFVREVVNAVKDKGGFPILIETHGMGNSFDTIEMNKDYSIHVAHRRRTEDHQKIATLHGYTQSVIGVPLHFIDGEDGIERKIVTIDGIHFDEVSVAKKLFDFDKMVVISHFKGHPLGGFGGALKQLGVGCVTKHNKFRAHFEGEFTVNERRCDISQCKQECVKSCPVRAIEIKNKLASINHYLCYGCFRCYVQCPIQRAIKAPRRRNSEIFVECFIDNAKGVLSFGPDKIRYISFAIDMPLYCDCVSNASAPVIPDLGIFGSSDPVAIDKACIDAETDAPGLPFLNKDGEWVTPMERGVEKFKALNPLCDPIHQFNAALKNKIGSINYELSRI